MFDWMRRIERWAFFRKYDEAIIHFKKCLGLTPRSPQTLIAIGFVHALQGNYGQAIEYLHQVRILSLGISSAMKMFRASG